MPPFKKGGLQFSSSQNRECYNIASVRIHVERAIGRLKLFKILTFVDHCMIKHLDKILICLAYTVNNFGPLIKEGKKNDQASNVDDDDGEDEDDEEEIIRYFDDILDDFREKQEEESDDIVFLNYTENE